MFKRKRKPEAPAEMAWFPMPEAPAVDPEVLADVVREVLSQERLTLADVRWKLEDTERFALRVRNERNALKVELAEERAAHSRTKADLARWIAEANHPEGLRDVDPDSPTAEVDMRHNLGLLLGEAWEPESVVIDSTIFSVPGSGSPTFSVGHPAWEDPDGLFLNDNCIDDIRGYCILEGCPHGRNEPGDRWTI